MEATYSVSRQSRRRSGAFTNCCAMNKIVSFASPRPQHNPSRTIQYSYILLLLLYLCIATQHDPLALLSHETGTPHSVGDSTCTCTCTCSLTCRICFAINTDLNRLRMIRCGARIPQLSVRATQTLKPKHKHNRTGRKSAAAPDARHERRQAASIAHPPLPSFDRIARKHALDGSAVAGRSAVTAHSGPR